LARDFQFREEPRNLNGFVSEGGLKGRGRGHREGLVEEDEVMGKMENRSCRLGELRKESRRSDEKEEVSS
jgi:hypothetical protein